MPIFKPFRAINSQSLNSLKDQEKKSSLVKHFIASEENFLKIPSEDFDQIKPLFKKLIKENSLIQSPTPCFYLYEKKTENLTQRGILGLTSSTDYHNEKLKKHEATIEEHLKEISQTLHTIQLQNSPVLLTYKINQSIENILNKTQKKEPFFEFSDPQKTSHRVWKIQEEKEIQELEKLFLEIDFFYIADGHHRAKCISNLNDKENFIYSFLVSENSIKIHDYNRLIKKTNLSHQEFLEKLDQYFIIENKGKNALLTQKKSQIGMYFNDNFYLLSLKKEWEENSFFLGHCILEKYILKNILNIENSSKHNSITYLKGNSSIEGIINLKNKADSQKYEVAFFIQPIGFEDFIKIADEKIKMPPKCTSINPKALHSLLIYDMENP